MRASFTTRHTHPTWCVQRAARAPLPRPRPPARHSPRPLFCLCCFAPLQNPIEKCFATYKASLRRQQNLARTRPIIAHRHALRSATREHMRNYYAALSRVPGLPALPNLRPRASFSRAHAVARAVGVAVGTAFAMRA